MSTNSFKIKNSAVLTPKDLSTLVSPEAGEIACDINDSNKIKRYDAASASWVEVGSGGVGSVDIMFVQDFESASLSSFTQTGLSLSTTNPLHGKVSAVLTHQAGINQSFKQVIPVDPKFRGQAMVLDLNVKSAASAGNVVIKVRDESNSSDLIVSEQLQLSNAVSGRRSSVSFTIPSTCSSLSYTITALPEAGSPVTRIDDIVAMLSDVSLLETSVLVPNMTAWQGYTPTFQGFGTPSNVEFEWRQVGENVEIRGKFTAGTPTAVEARIGLPNGLTSAGTSLIPSIQSVGATAYANSGSFYHTVLAEPSVTYLTIGVQDATRAGLSKRTGSDAVGSGIALSFFASVPCAGLSATSTKTIPLTQSGLVQNPDSYLNLINATSSAGVLTFTNILENRGSSLNLSGSTITVLNSGIYSINTTAQFTTVDSRIFITKNSTSVVFNDSSVLDYGSTQNTGGYEANAGWTGYLNAGDIIRVTHTGTLTGGANAKLSIANQSSLKQVSVSSDQKITIPTSELRFEGLAGKGSTATRIVRFNTLAKVRGDAYSIVSDGVSGTAITMRKAGKLDVSTTLRSTSVGALSITLNQANTATDPLDSEVIINQALPTINTDQSAATSVMVKIGDIIRVSTNTTIGTVSAGILTLSFQEQDISVSVTNTLPQFSDSDSSVRVDTANGYGSTANKIRRFSNVRDNIGADIAYVDDSVNGASFTVKSAGVYNISYTEQASSAAFFGLSKNSSQLTTSIISITTAERLAIGTTDSVSGYPETIAWQGYLQAGDVIRAHTEGALGSAGPDRSQFTISKVGKPNVTGVNVTPFVNLDLTNKTTVYSASISAAGAISNENETFISSCSVASNQFTVNFKPGVFTVAPNCVITPLEPTAINGTMVMIVSQSSSTLVYKIVRHDSVAITAPVNIILQKQGADYNPSYNSILTPTDTFSTDTASLSYKSSSEYTLSTLQNAPVGTYITFTYAANTNTRTQTTTRPTQTDADMNANGILLTTRIYANAGTAAEPRVFAIQIGKGMKGVSKNLYKSAGKVTAGSTDFVVRNTANQSGLYFQDYNEVTGILILDCGYCALSTIGASEFNFTDVSSQTSGYLVINASKNPALTGLGLGTVAAKGVSSSGQVIPATTLTTVTYDAAKTYDTHGALNAATGVFTAPESGYYQVSASFEFTNAAYAIAAIVYCQLYKNSVLNLETSIFIADRAASYAPTPALSTGIYLAKGDTLYVQLYNARTGGTALASNIAYNFFSIHKTSVGTGN